ncbi:DEAD/DEAH box helicase [Mesorhizobium sp. M0862]|uniref:DEAD/DEAH box helicase n=1 Tax=Mesorhizobium sp. M0862 TaxID=2957015 RepID=UPI00333D8B36
MIDELIRSIWANENFHSSLLGLRAAWLRNVLSLEAVGEITDLDLVKCVQAATILANSTDAEIQRAAFSIAACASDLRSEDMPGLNGALRIVLTRLGNFPAVNTSSAVSGFSRLPTRTAVSEQLRRNGNEVKVGQAILTLTDFQRLLWGVLSARRNVSISAPTSAGKSYVLQSFLREIVASDLFVSACYIVPSRALIAQVTDSINSWKLDDGRKTWLS